jgi:hypothetical protein
MLAIGLLLLALRRFRLGAAIIAFNLILVLVGLSYFGWD